MAEEVTANRGRNAPQARVDIRGEDLPGDAPRDEIWPDKRATVKPRPPTHNFAKRPALPVGQAFAGATIRAFQLRIALRVGHCSREAALRGRVTEPILLARGRRFTELLLLAKGKRL